MTCHTYNSPTRQSISTKLAGLFSLLPFPCAVCFPLIWRVFISFFIRDESISLAHDDAAWLVGWSVGWHYPKRSVI